MGHKIITVPLILKIWDIITISAVPVCANFMFLREATVY
jgi:hypothetical protein